MAQSVNDALTTADKKSVLISASAMAVWLMVLGFPLIDWDSGRYLERLADPLCYPLTAPTIPYWIFRPIAFFAGPWTIPVVANVLLAYTAGMTSRVVLGRVSAPAILSALLLSGTHLWVNYVLVDSFFSVGILAAFCLSNRFHQVPMAMILILCCFWHSANVIGLAFVAFVALLLARRRFLSAVFAIAVMAGCGVLLALNVRLFGVVSPFSKLGGSFFVGRVMAEVPETIEEFAEAHPDSGLATKKDVFLEKANRWRERPDLLAKLASWEGAWSPYVQYWVANTIDWHQPMPVTDWERAGFTRDEQSEYLRFVFKRRPLQLILGAVRNPFLFMAQAGLRGVETWPFQFLTNPAFEKGNRLSSTFPTFADRFGWGLQAKVRENPKLASLLFPGIVFAWAFTMAFLANLIVVSVSILRHKGLPSHGLQFAALVVLACFVHSLTMSNLATFAPRYFTWMYFLPVFAAILGTMFWLHEIAGQPKSTYHEVRPLQGSQCVS